MDLKAYALALPMICWAAPAWAQSKQPDPVILAQQQLAAGNCTAVVEILGKLMHGQTRPAIEVYLMLGHCYRELRETDAAGDVLRQGLKKWPGAPILERTLGELLFQLKYDSSEAGTLLERAARMLPRDPEAKHYYAQWAYLNARDRICATQEQAATALPGLSDLALLQMYTLLGMCQSRLEDATGARSAFEHAAVINNRQARYDPVAAMEYVQFLTRYNDESRAATLVEEIIGRVPEFGPAHLQRARFFDKAAKPAEAVEEARIALAAAGNDLNSERAARTLLARCLRLLGRTDEASVEEKWIREHPNPEAPRP